MSERSQAIASLRHRDFLLIWLGQLASSIGDQMQVVAIAWAVYVLTGSVLQVGLIGLFRLIPFLLLSLVGGAIADTADRKLIIVASACVQMAASAALAVTAFAGVSAVWLLFAVTFVGGIATAFDAPARNALIANVVPRAEMSNAYTLIILLRQVAQIAGPALGGVAVAIVGLGATYLTNTASFLAVIAALLLMRPIHVPPPPESRSLERIVVGLKFALTDRLIMLPLVMDVGTRLFVSTRPLLPLLAAQLFLMGPQGLGWLNTAPAVGAVVGGVALSARRQMRRPLYVMLVAFAVEGLFVIGLGLSAAALSLGRLTAFGIAMAMLFAAGFCDVLSNVPRTTIIQSRTPDELRGRVSAVMNIFSNTGPQLGQVEMGAIATAMGPAGGAIASGIVAALLPLFGLLHKQTRQDVFSDSSAIMTSR